MEYTLRNKVWVYPGAVGWHFVTLSKKVAKEIKAIFGGVSGGFGSLPVEVRVGTTVWQTSIFPDKKSGSYVLPLKASVREKEGIAEGTMLSYTIRIQP